MVSSEMVSRPSTSDPEPTPKSTESSRFPVPAPLSLALLLATMIAVVVIAMANERVVAEQTTVRREVAETQVRDVLTGRKTTATGQPAPPETGWGTPQKPIRFRFVPSSDQASATVGIDSMLAFLRERTGYTIEGAILRSYGLVVQEIAQGQAEVAFLTATSYARARFATDDNDNPNDDVEAILAIVRYGDTKYPGSDLAYRGAIIVRTGSDITDISQLDETRTIAMGARTSGASSILPTAMLNQLGLEPRVQRYEGYPIIVSAVLQGAVDAGCVWWSPPNDELPNNDARITVAQTNPDVFDKTRIIGYTPWIPNEPIVVRKALPADVQRVLARALTLYVGTKALTPEGRRELIGVGGMTALIPASNDDYQPLMEIIDGAFINDPEGRADFMASSK